MREHAVQEMCRRCPNDCKRSIDEVVKTCKKRPPIQKICEDCTKDCIAIVTTDKRGVQLRLVRCSKKEPRERSGL